MMTEIIKMEVMGKKHQIFKLEIKRIIEIQGIIWKKEMVDLREKIKSWIMFLLIKMRRSMLEMTINKLHQQFPKILICKPLINHNYHINKSSHLTSTLQ